MAVRRPPNARQVTGAFLKGLSAGALLAMVFVRLF